VSVSSTHAREARLRVPFHTRLIAIAQYPRALGDHWFLLRTARGISERKSILAFMFVQYLVFFGLLKRHDRRVQFRDHTYFAEGAAELFALIEIYRDGHYGRDEAFLPREGTTVVDVGANIGSFTIYHAAAGARVLAVEPNASSHRRLVAAVEANGLGDRVIVVRTAIGAQRGRSRIVAAEGLTVMGRVVPLDSEAPIQDDEVEVSPLDETVSAHALRDIDLLKIDVEGAEVDALLGGTATLARTRRVILEYHSDALLAETRRLLAAAGFNEVREYRISPGVGMLYVARPFDSLAQ